LFKLQGQKNVRGIENDEFAYTPLPQAWQDFYIDGIVEVSVHPTLPEQDLVLRSDGCGFKGLAEGTI